MPTKLGQNFLKDPLILNKLIQATNLSSTDFVIEVGPGEGILTEQLIKHAKKVIAIEIDQELAVKLASRLRGNNKIEIITADILKINLPELISAETVETRHCLVSTDNKINHPYKVIANIPYYITSPIIRLFLETKYPPTEMFLMVQKEVAERICAKAGKLSILALSVQYYATAELLFLVPRTAFAPVPAVDSAIIHITLNTNREEQEVTKKFFKLIKAGFSAKRKTLINNLSNSLKLEKTIVEQKLKQINISAKQRAQELTLEDWKKIAELL
jgi:16S rRNA (adenine1518-N6/adenine1519-N6)-dimethyltransferase